MNSRPVSNRDVKRRNRSNTLRSILACDHISQMELCQRLDLSWPTVLQNVKELIEMGLVREGGLYESSGGRKAKSFEPVRDARLAVGLDLTRNHVSAVLVDLGGRVIDHVRQRRPFSWDSQYRKELGDLVCNMAAGRDTDGRILGVGISVPGVVSADDRQWIYSHVLEVENVSFDEFERNIPYPCVLINDANAAGISELYGTSGSENLVYLSASNSVGGSIANDGKLYYGKHFRAGEFGHHTLVPGGRLCYCGKKGCADAYLSTKILAETSGDNLNSFFEGLRTGDPEKKALWEKYLDYLAVEVNNLHMSFDCDVIVGGYLGAYEKDLEEPLRLRLEERNTFGRDTSYFKVGHYKLEASAVGAALLRIEDFIEGV